MISLKRIMESQVDDLVNTVLSAYRSTIQEVARAAARAHPQSGAAFSEKFEQLSRRLTPDAPPASITATGGEVARALDGWSNKLDEVNQQRVVEVQQILKMVAGLAQSVADRDIRYGVQLSRIGDTMQKIASLDEISEIRIALAANSAVLTTCLTQMERDGQESVARMRLELASYEARLESAEREATTDPLTRLFNRRAAERQMLHLQQQGLPFCMVILDLNRFKDVNDSHGHQTGDELLRQFGEELRASTGAGETVARWGGDEFLVLLRCTLVQAEQRARQILERISGDYTIETSKTPIRISLQSSVGIAEWDCIESMPRLIERADASMYSHKSVSRSATAVVAR